MKYRAFFTLLFMVSIRWHWQHRLKMSIQQYRKLVKMLGRQHIRRYMMPIKMLQQIRDRFGTLGQL